MKLFRQRQTHFQQFTALIAQPRNLAAVHAGTSVPEEVAKWLGKLKVLQGVPFNYLVPTEAMLPADSIRFFNVDLNWIYSLLEGAFSIGRSTSGDTAHDTVFAKRVHAVADVAAKQVRAPMRDVGLMKALTSEENALAAAPPEATANQRITGFLLRSPVVSGWPKLEVTAYDGNGPLTKVLRMEHIAPEILLFMVEGVISYVDIKEPAEGLHFGVDLEVDGGPCGKRSLRWVTVPASAPAPAPKPGDEIEVSATGGGTQVLKIPIPCRGKRVLKIAALAAAVKTALDGVHANDETNGTPRQFTPAEFALEMVEGVQGVRFRNVPPRTGEADQGGNP